MLEVQSLSAAYGERQVLKDITLSVHPGEVLALVGPNGAGKSTLIKVISGVKTALDGRVQVQGQDVTRLSSQQRARLLAVVPQAKEMPGDFTVSQAVMLGRTPYLHWLGRPDRLDSELSMQAMQRTQLTEMMERRVGELSGGEQQRVLLARALAQDTPVLLLDEPTNHLDLQHQARILSLVRLLADDLQRAVLMVLHDLNWAAIYADRVALLAEGALCALGTPQEVLTGENLSATYGIPVGVITHPEYGTPLVLPDGIHRNGK